MPKILTVQEAYARLSSLCAKFEHAPGDLVRKMEEYGMSPRDIAQVMQRLVDEGFVNEERYAHAFVHDKVLHAGWGRLKIDYALKVKGISSDIRRQALEQVDGESYEATLLKILKAKNRIVKAQTDYERKGKLLRFAASRGFEQNLVYDLLENMEEW